MLNIYDPHLMDIGEPHLILSLLVLDEHPMPHHLPTLPPAHRACLSLAQFTSSLKNLCLLLLAAPVLLIAHNFDFWNWRTCPPVDFVLQFWRTTQIIPLVLEDRVKHPIINLYYN